MGSIILKAPDGYTSCQLHPESGGRLSSLIMSGSSFARELLYTAGTKEPPLSGFEGGWPFCFPICGRLLYQGVSGAYMHQGQRYEMPIHGFAQQCAWQVHDLSGNQVTLTLQDNQHTRLCYPFSFQVTMRYQLLANTLLLNVCIDNQTKEAMPYYAGFHPYFLLPVDKKPLAMLNFNSDECFSYDVTLTQLSTAQPPLPLPLPVSDARLNEQLSRVTGSNQFSLTYPDGDQLSMHVAASRQNPFPYIQLYTPKDEPFICVEQWMAYPNALNQSGAVRWLPPGEKDHAQVMIQLHQQSIH